MLNDYGISTELDFLTRLGLQYNEQFFHMLKWYSLVMSMDKFLKISTLAGYQTGGLQHQWLIRWLTDWWYFVDGKKAIELIWQKKTPYAIIPHL